MKHLIETERLVLRALATIESAGGVRRP